MPPDWPKPAERECSTSSIRHPRHSESLSAVSIPQYIVILFLPYFPSDPAPDIVDTLPPPRPIFPARRNNTPARAMRASDRSTSHRRTRVLPLRPLAHMSQSIYRSPSALDRYRPAPID